MSKLTYAFSVCTVYFAVSATVSASSSLPPACGNPLGYEEAAQELVAERYQCDSADVCGLSFKVPMVLDGRRFLGFLLLFSDGRQGTITLAHESDEREEYAYSSFELPRPYFRTITVHAIYDFEVSCALRSVWTPSATAVSEVE
ncbi:MAG: hypothetical protein AAF417_16030 [Pseudomonadota bacterium]